MARGDVVGHAPARRGLSAIVAVGAALLLVGPVAAQSPSPSLVPVASVAPSTGATTPVSLADIEAGLATQACDAFLTAAELTTVAGVAVTRREWRVGRAGEQAAWVHRA